MCAAMRELLYGIDSCEVWTPVLSPYPDIAPVPQFVATCPTSGAPACLRIAPTEFLKQLVVQGATSVFEFSTNFRADNADATHLCEFTSLEVMVRGATCRDMQSLVTQLCRVGLSAVRGAERLPLGTFTAPGVDQSCDLDLPWEAVSLRDLLSARYNFTPDDFFDTAAVQRLFADVVGGPAPASNAEAFDAIVTGVASTFRSPVFVADYPWYLGGPAHPCADDPRFKERAELFVGPMELANMSSSLNEYSRIESWYSTTYEMKQVAGIRPNRIDVPLMAALRDGLPSSAVLGIGLDRLLMIALGSHDISDVRSFPYTTLFNMMEVQPCFP